MKRKIILSNEMSRVALLALKELRLRQGARIELFERIGGNMDETVGFNDEENSWSDFKRWWRGMEAWKLIERTPFEDRMKGREDKDSELMVWHITDRGLDYLKKEYLNLGEGGEE